VCGLSEKEGKVKKCKDKETIIKKKKKTRKRMNE
jgi:hypothetical protein